MRCIWSTTASNAGAASYSRAGISRLRFPPTMRISATSAALSYSYAGAPDSISVPDAVDAVPEESTSLPNLLAIRMCLRNGGIADAHRNSSSALPFKMPEFEAAALQFGPEVSQRLSAHPAFELAKMMMAEGVVLRSATLEAVINSLVSFSSMSAPASRIDSITTYPFASPSPSIPLKLASDVLLLRPSNMADQRTRLALKLLFLAHNMFKLFMAASLLNGELIIFSDWQTAYSLERTLEVIPEDDELQSSSQVNAARLRWNHLRSETILPDRKSMESALSVINSILTRDGETPEPTHARLVALQALGNLAGLLDRRQIPFPQIETLLTTMYGCPRVQDEIWIVGPRGCPERIKAHEYIHRVIRNLIRSLPSHPLSLRQPSVAPCAISINRRYDMLPPLKLYGYNTLLHYALRHRLSPALGEVVLSHGMEKRWKPITPSTSTANILLRSGTLMRKYDIVTQVLQSMGPPTFVPEVPFTPPILDDDAFLPENKLILPTESVPVIQRTEMVKGWGSKLRRISHEKIQIPDLPSNANIYTLTSYIVYLTATGQPRAVRELLFEVIPELKSEIYRTNSERKEDRRLGRMAFLAAIRRSITLGPVFFSVILDALYKSGQPALADRVWHLAKKAERGSWMRYHVPECEPWIFGPQVYTIMLNCYGDLARRRQTYDLRIDQRTTRRTAKDSGTPPPPHQVLELLHRFMGKAALDVFRRLFDLRHEYARIPQLRKWLAEEDIPKPDARFFNAALRVFRPRTDPRPESWYRKQLEEAKNTLVLHGVLPDSRGWNLALHEVAEYMMDAGYSLPLGVQYLFVGRLEGIEEPAAQRPDRGPYVYSRYRPRSFIRFRVPTPKERGLPVSRIYTRFRTQQRRALAQSGR
ncbi:hypothetical protein B0H11DRAFT_2030297 [Mycena galericulata]|nr:hypothetical protein B0H11DRAFT_2030297 [Mycena galericulata]